MLTQQAAAYGKPPKKRPWPQPFPTVLHPCQWDSQELPQACRAARRRSCPTVSSHASWRWPGRGLWSTQLCRSYWPLLPGRPRVRQQHWGLVRLAGRQRAGQEDWSQGWLRLSGAKADEQPALPRCREELHGFSSSHGHRALLCPEQPRWQRAQHTTHPPAPLCTKARSGFLRLCGGNSAQQCARRRTFPPAQRVTGDPEPSVFQQCRLRSSPARNTPCRRGWAAAGTAGL